jgi:hypothetical protein
VVNIRLCKSDPAVRRSAGAQRPLIRSSTAILGRYLQMHKKSKPRFRRVPCSYQRILSVVNTYNVRSPLEKRRSAIQAALKKALWLLCLVGMNCRTIKGVDKTDLIVGSHAIDRLKYNNSIRPTEYQKCINTVYRVPACLGARIALR